MVFGKNVMKNKRILIVSPLLPKYHVEFLERFAITTDYDLHVSADIKSKNDLTLDKYDNYKFNVHHLPFLNVGPFQNTLGLNKLIKELNPDLIIFSASPRDLTQIFSIVKQKLIGRKIAIWSMFHRIGGPRLYSSLYYKFLGKIANRNFTYSNIGKYYQIARGVSEKKIHVIGTAIDEEKVFDVIKKSNLKTNDLIKEYSLEEKFILLQVLRLTSIKKPYFLIDMMKELVIKEQNSILVLIGGGSMEDEIKAYVKLNNLTNNILFLGPIYDETILSNWFSLSDIFVIPTCIGLSAQHACCYGLPIVTDNSLSNQASEFDILQDRLNCLLYEENNVESFVEKILELKNNKNLYDRISKNALVTVKETFSLNKKVENFKRSIEKI